MILTKAAAQGLKTIAAHAGAGGPADLEMAERGKAADRAWAGVEAAIDWALGLRPGRQIVLVLSPAEAEELESVFRHALTPGALNMPARPLGRAALRKLQAARQAFDDDLRGKAGQADAARSGRFQQPAEAIEPAAAADDEPDIDANRPLCTMCAERNVPETGDLCDSCRATWGGVQR